MNDRDLLISAIDDLIRGGMTGMGVLIAMRSRYWQRQTSVTDPALIDAAIDSVRNYQVEIGGPHEIKVLDTIWSIDKGRVVAMTRIA